MLVFITAIITPILSIPVEVISPSQQQANTAAQKPEEKLKTEQQPQTVQQDDTKTVPILAIGVPNEAIDKPGGAVIVGGNQPDDLNAGADANPTNPEAPADLETANTFWGGYGGWGGYYRRPSYGYGGWGGSGWRRGYGDYGYGGGWGWRGRGLYGGWGWGSPYYY